MFTEVEKDILLTIYGKVWSVLPLSIKREIITSANFLPADHLKLFRAHINSGKDYPPMPPIYDDVFHEGVELLNSI